MDRYAGHAVIIRFLLSLPRRIRRWLVRAQMDSVEAALAIAAGDAARDRREWKEAALQYRRALEARPGLTGIRVQLGNMLKECGELTDAEAQYRVALEDEPKNADTYLQLGHVLKLQVRLNEACDAYLAAACLDPHLQSARTELRAAGLSDVLIERHTFAATQYNAEHFGTTTAPDNKSRTPIDAGYPIAVRGLIREVGRDFIIGDMQDVSHEMLPLTLVCRDSQRELAVTVIDRDTELATTYPRTIPFRLDIKKAVTKGVLRVTLEPAGIELVGSPLVLPDENGSALMERISRLEDYIARSNPPGDLVAQLERRLTPHVTRIAADRLERVIRYQREAFERQLLLVQSRLVGLQGPLPPADPVPAPTSISFAAHDEFPGLGWGIVDIGPGGAMVRHVSQRAWLSTRLAKGCGAVLQVQIPEEVNRAQLARLSAGAAGNRIPYWIGYRRASDEQPAHWRMAALVPVSAIEPDGTLTCFIDRANGLRGNADDEGIPISLVTLNSIPSLSSFDFACNEKDWWVVQEDAAGQSLTLVLPGLITSTDVQLEMVFATEISSPDVVLNDHRLTLEGGANGKFVANVLASVWAVGRPNLLRVRSDAYLLSLGSGTADHALLPAISG